MRPSCPSHPLTPGLGEGRWLEFFSPLGVVSFSYQRALDTLAFRAGSADCAPTWLRTRVRTCVSTVWAFSFVQLLPCAPSPSANCQARQCALLERLWHSAIAESTDPQLSSGRRCPGASLGGSRYCLTDGLTEFSRAPREKPEQTRI